jgi:antitoxin component of MazEF toxin-antitoxin module
MNSMNGKSSDHSLDQAIDQILRGREPDLERGSDAELRPLLKHLETLSILRQTMPIPDSGKSLERMLVGAKILAAEREGAAPTRWRFNLSWKFATGLAATLLIALSGLLFLGTSESQGVQSILPDSPFYAAKRWGESLAVRLPRANPEQGAFEAQLAHRRQMEIHLLQVQRREAHITFAGLVEAIEHDRVLVSGIVCPLACGHDPPHAIAAIEIIGALKIGVPVIVEAFTLADGSLHIASIVVQE